MYVFDGPQKNYLNWACLMTKVLRDGNYEYFVAKDIPADVYYLIGEGKCIVSPNKDEVWVKDHHQYYYKFQLHRTPYL